jgi:hypothetical protein
MISRFGFVLLLTLAVTSCSGEHVALNERLFAVSSMASEGAGCTLFELGGGSQESSGAGTLGFVVMQQLQGSEVVVSVSEGTRLVGERRYAESFFQSGSVDDLVAQSDAGTDLLLRHWGKLNPSGMEGCSPLDVSEP